MTKQTVLIDLDGVLVESLTPWLAAWNLRYGAETGLYLSRDAVTAYAFDLLIPEDLRKQFFGLLHEASVFEHALPELGAVEAMHHLLADDRFDVVIVTTVLANCPSGEAQKRAWLRRWLPEFDQRNLVFTSRKELVSGDWLAEDSYANVNKWCEAHPCGQSWLVTQPYNQHGDGNFATFVKYITRGGRFV